MFPILSPCEKEPWKRVIPGVIAFLLVFGMQRASGKVGYFIAGMIPYQQLDLFDSFARISIHHAVQLLIAAVLILLLGKRLHLDFHFHLGDTKSGVKSLVIFMAAFVVISSVQHALMALNNQLPAYGFPLDVRNIVGTLGFQVLLSGPTEEIVYRALPITLFSHAFGRSVEIKGNCTLEVILSSVLFAFAHIKWSVIPLSFEADYFQVIYAFVLGTIQGVVYQKSRSIIYPVLMHSFSNVMMVGTGYLFTVWFS